MLEMLTKVLFICCISLAVIESRHINKIKHGKRTETANTSADGQHESTRGIASPHGNFSFNSDSAKESVSMSYISRRHDAKKKSVEPSKMVQDLVQNGTMPSFKVNPNEVDGAGERNSLQEEIKRNITALKQQGKKINSVLAIVRQTDEEAENTTPTIDQDGSENQETDGQQSPEVQETPQQAQSPQQEQAPAPANNQDASSMNQSGPEETDAESQPTVAPAAESGAGQEPASGSDFPYPTPSPNAPPENSVQVGDNKFVAKVIEKTPSQAANDAATETPSTEEQQSQAPAAPTEAQTYLSEATTQAPVDVQTSIAATETTVVMKTPTTCPEEIESLGCFSDPDPNSRVFPQVVMTKDPADSLEQFLCSCASTVQSQGLFTFGLQDGVCYSGSNEGDYDLKGESKMCKNESGLVCGDDDVYCQGDAGANSVYSVLTLQHPTVVKP